MSSAIVKHFVKRRRDRLSIFTGYKISRSRQGETKVIRASAAISITRGRRINQNGNKSYLRGRARESADQARLDKVEKCSQEAALSKQRTGHPSSSRTPSSPKPISSVLARFYHGAVYHRLPRQCRCCSHCTAHGDAVVTHIPLPNTPTGRIKHVGTTVNLSARSHGNGTVERQTEGRQLSRSFPERLCASRTSIGNNLAIIAKKDRSLTRGWWNRES